MIFNNNIFALTPFEEKKEGKIIFIVAFHIENYLIQSCFVWLFHAQHLGQLSLKNVSQPIKKYIYFSDTCLECYIAQISCLGPPCCLKCIAIFLLLFFIQNHEEKKKYLGSTNTVVIHSIFINLRSHPLPPQLHF